MQQKTKIQFSELEQQLMKNAGWILTKNAVMEKMKGLLQECLDIQNEILEDYKTSLPQEVLYTSPKISRGENYKGLPWLMLDHPRHFDKENIFAIRTFFWWGQYFSITLHLSGMYKTIFAHNIIAAHRSLVHEQFYCCVNSNEWQHHFEEENYKMIKDLSEKQFHQIIDEKNFIKLSKKIELDKWHNLPLHAAAINKWIFEMLA